MAFKKSPPKSYRSRSPLAMPTYSSTLTAPAVMNDKILEELQLVRAERDLYHSKLMRVKEKLSTKQLRSTPSNPRRQRTPVSAKISQKSRSCSKSVNSRKSDCGITNI